MGTSGFSPSRSTRAGWTTSRFLDLRVEKGFRLAAGRRVAGFVDGFNLFNANPEETVSWTSGPSFLRPLNIVAPRIVRIGTKLEW